MAVDEQLDRLSSQLSRHGLGGIDAVSAEVTSRVGSAFIAVASSLRRAADDQPLVTLLLAAQAGYLLARLGRRYAGN
jgi:thiamine monophosphate synthase